MKTFIFFIFLSFVLLGRSLLYTFHYDDYTRLVLNPAEKSISVAATSFTDRNSQSINPELNTHTYRPLFVINMAIQHQLWGLRPAGYRAINILLHGVNAALVGWLAANILGLGIVACLISGLVFLVHPAQVESVVWVVEQSNVMATTLLLLGLYLWKKKHFRTMTFIYIAGLLVRESMAAFPIVIFILGLYENKTKKPKKENLYVLAVLLVVSISYLLWRHHILGATSQIWPDGMAIPSYLNQIVIATGMALQFLFFPIGTSINHQPWPPILNPALLITCLALITASSLFTIFLTINKKSKWALGLAIGIALWLPTSQLIPIKSVFSERFLYPVLIGMALFCGTLYEKLSKNGRAAIWLAVGGLSILSLVAVTIWQNDKTLWAHALRKNPSYWNTWVFMAEWERVTPLVANELHQPQPIGWRERAEENYIQALKCGLPSSDGARIFLRLSELNFQQGKRDQAEFNGRRAVELNPFLESDFEKLRRRYVNGLKT